MIKQVICAGLLGVAWTFVARAVESQSAPTDLTPSAVAGTKSAKPGLAVSADPATDWKRSKPGVVVYLPNAGGNQHDGDNEMFLVFKAPKSDELLGMWTQSSVEGHGDNRIMLARSSDGVHWAEPRRIAGTEPGEMPGPGHPPAVWGVPIVSRTGRLYCLYQTTKRQGGYGNTNLTTGMSGGLGSLYSDDNGATWTAGAEIQLPRNRFDHPAAAMAKSYWLWTTSTRDRQGRHLLGYTAATSQAVKKPPSKLWVHRDTRCAFARLENIDDGPDPKDLKITWLPANSEGLEVPNRVFPDMSVAQEPCVVLLPDGRLLVAMRTMAGAIWYSLSDDDGATWRKTEPLRYRDGGEPIAQPLAPAPIYPLADGRFLLVFHNNDGTHGGYSQWKTNWAVNQANYLRNPAFIAIGEFRPRAHQPIWFSPPKQILDTQGIIVGPKKTAEIATYPSLTEWRGQRVLWYPDRKYYLLGKYLPDTLLADMKVPEAAATRQASSRADSNPTSEAPPRFPSELRWLALTNAGIEVDGLPWFKENQGSLSRLPARSKDSLRPAVWNPPAGREIAPERTPGS